ncbi:hypothetical protein KQI68_06445 [Peptoniphilus sp. MSJ-1]|uniref:Uncharacterized protein n=1 Tax=Peptoniphilus ovalis TaxID=2841503 RepID=A0ABS6FHN1_9FIRM|nr:hypothetical protein [Peptoniphilus ovalis]MBU5669476.1 hypothetical protein [Peptoniphilus ovalis]
MAEERKLKTSPAQAKARDKWDSKNKENKKRRTYKSGCKNYILKLADQQDLEEVESWIEEARKKF